MTKIDQTVVALFLLSLAQVTYGGVQRQLSSQNVKFSVYDWSEQKYLRPFTTEFTGDMVIAIEGPTQFRPDIVLDPVVIGNPEDHPGKMVIQKYPARMLMIKEFM